jgi:hypothetical protein
LVWKVFAIWLTVRFSSYDLNTNHSSFGQLSVIWTPESSWLTFPKLKFVEFLFGKVPINGEHYQSQN